MTVQEAYPVHLREPRLPWKTTKYITAALGDIKPRAKLGPVLTTGCRRTVFLPAE